jgi:type VI secretion system protein ImpK
MSRISSTPQAALSVDIDSLLQDSYLLVVELRQDASIYSSQELAALCVKQIEHVRQQLEQAHLSPRSIDHISHAQCALLDETVLGCALNEAHADWAREPLQARFFKHHQAGEFLYEHMREVLREAAPDLPVLTAFQRVLTLGFQGRYRDVNDPEREQLLSALNAQVAPLKLNQTLEKQLGVRPRSATLTWVQSPLTHVVAAGLLLAAVWWGLDHRLIALIATLVPGQM